MVISPSDGQRALHLTIRLPPKYPLDAPVFSMDSQVDHPNVFSGYICADVLGAKYTPAYTLKSICIQILSFFASDNIERLPPELGLLWDDGLRGFEVGSNAFRVPNYRVLETGTEATLRWLRDKIPASASAADAASFD